MSLEIHCYGDVIGCRAGCDLAPEQQLVRVGQLRKSHQSQLQLQSTCVQSNLSGVSIATPIYSSAWLSSLMQ